MSSDLTRCNCCNQQGCGCGSGVQCNGTFFPASVQVTFTPHWLGAWTGEFVGSCNFSGQTDPPCNIHFESLGDYPEWYTGSPVTLTLDAVDDGSCFREYELTTPVAVSSPGSLPGWSENPMGLSSASSKWCTIDTSKSIFGTGNYFSAWSATLTLKATQCDSAGTGGTDTNTMTAVLEIELQRSTGGNIIVMDRRLIVTSSETECSCYRPKFGTGAWSAHCPGNDCYLGIWSVNQQAAYKTDWSEYALGSETVTWSTDPFDDCCESHSVDVYYTGGQDWSATTEDCPENVNSSDVCAGTNDAYKQYQLDFGLHTGDTDKGYHVGTKYNSDEFCFAYCIVKTYGFGFSSYPALTDISLDV